MTSTESTTEQTGTGTETGQAGTGQGGTEQTQTAATGQAQATEAQDVKSLPPWAQTLIKEVRGEAATNRVKASQLEQASQAQLDTIAKALGLKPADADPAKLAEELAKAKTTARDTAIELAVYRAAGKHGADPDALLDSRAFLGAVTDLDPATADFATKVESAIKTAVKEHPKLKAAAATASRSGGDGPPGGGTAKSTPTTLDDAIAARYA
jgi:hypothetical protein